MLRRFLSAWGFQKADSLFANGKYAASIEVYRRITQPIDLRLRSVAMMARAYYLLSDFENSKNYFVQLREEAEQFNGSGDERSFLAEYFIVYANQGLSKLKEKIDLGFHLDNIIYCREQHTGVPRRILRDFPLAD